MILEGAQPTLFRQDPGEVVSMLVDFVHDGILPAEAAPQPGVAGAAASDPAPPPAGLSRSELDVLRLLAAGSPTRRSPGAWA